ncbi:transposase [Bacteroides heparinolyticus]|uniref:transposase n=1 Tax=Prevotella heparinolytica TaxID=28113 RepID=UPI0035A0D089
MQVHLQREPTRKVRPRNKTAVATDLQEVFSKRLSTNPRRWIDESFRAFADRWSGSYPFLSKIASGKWIAYYFTYLKYEVVARKYIHSTNWLERFNGQIKKGARYNRCALPSIDSALHLIGNIALNTTYLRKKIGDLTAGLRKVK